MGLIEKGKPPVEVFQLAQAGDFPRFRKKYA
jgi:hypothetical protein